MQDTKKMILQNADLLGIRLSPGDKKEVSAKRMADTILHEPLVVLRRLPYSELLRLQAMVHDEDHAVSVPNDLTWDCLTQISFSF